MFSLFPQCGSLCSYLVELRNQSTSISPINAVIYTVQWVHGIASVTSPTEDSFVQVTWNDCKRVPTHPVQPKDPLNVDILRRLAADSDHADLMELRQLVLCLLCYSCTLYIQEALNIRVKNIEFSDSGLRLFVPKRKNDQYRNGHYVAIAATGSQACPVATVKRFIEDAKLATDSYLLCRIAPTKKGYIAKGSANFVL